MSYFPKGKAYTGFTFGLLDDTGAAVTTGTTNGFVTIDNGTQAALTNAVTHKGNGQWAVDLTAAELNGDAIGLVFTNSNGFNTYFHFTTISVMDQAMVDHAGVGSIGSFISETFNLANNGTSGFAALEADLTTIIDALTAMPVDAADELLTRDWSLVTEAAAGVRNLQRALRLNINRWEIDTVANPPELVLYQEDDTTESHRIPLSSNASANPIDGFR